MCASFAHTMFSTLLPMKIRHFLCAAALTIVVGGCEAPSTVTSSDPTYGAKSSGSASPAILYVSQESVKGKSLYTLSVCDADGTDATILITGSNAVTRYWGQPTWSGDASKISYIESDTGRTSCSLKTASVSLVNGKPTAGTPTTLITVSKSANNKVMAGGIWSPTEDEIAYSLQDHGVGTFYTRQSHIYVIPSGGGTPEPVYTSPAGSSIYHISWNAAGTKLVLLEWEGVDDDPLTVNNHIKVIDRSTGNVDQSFNLNDFGLTNCSFMQCSKSGENSIAINHTGTNSAIYTIDLDNPTSATLVQSAAGYPTWSPDNSKLAYRTLSSSGYITTETLSSGATSNILFKGATLLHWKK
jgi:Tol biopolymer transport system component